MLKVNPFAEGYPKWEPLEFKVCTNEPSLVSVIYDHAKQHYKLHLNVEVSLKHFSHFSDFGCTYTEVVPGPADVLAYLKSPEYFHQDWIVPNHFLGVIVECHEMANKSRILQRDAFSFVQYPKNRNEKNDRERGGEYPSVLLLGIDSMSRMNFRRSMPLTSDFVSQEGWFEMEGYNKVGENTLPNLMALLTGRTPRQWRSKCDVRESGCLDSLVFLWNHFHSAGYLTAYADDSTSISTFNYLKMGFKRPPVDFYLRPFLMAIEQTLKYFDFKYCIGRRHSFSYVFDFAKQLIERFVFEQPKPLFGVFWTSSFTHDDFRGGANLDRLFVGYMEEFKKLRLFDRSIVILFSDHGSKHGPLVEHYTGFLEERQPMLHIYLPPWYRRRHPSVEKALILNRNRLSSNYDLHLVLPSDRSCSDAGIPDHWCTCQPFVGVQVTLFITSLAKLAVSRMNKYLKMLNLDEDCQSLKLSAVLRADRQLHFNESGNEMASPNNVDTYRLVFTTKPNNAKFRSTVYSRENNEIVTIQTEMISRLNSYRNESHCVQDALAKKFCLCYKDQFRKGKGALKERKLRYVIQENEDDFYDETK
ncbi:uncharacterized protein LOC108110423 [Drosophila eugracilis]|uniref:uncharacterized protein LOC108110423 n=1 Tax=Drosophila eugracilis TaxID=29029 RepID=UPI001BD9824C|nr:uncharacterized protein LOC108110423 [Drosophila eugracilis]